MNRILDISFGSGFLSGALGSLGGSAFMMYGGSFATSSIGTYAFSGLMGGIGSVMGGGNFWKGLGIGFMNAGLNHLAQGVMMKFRHDKVGITFDPGADQEVNSKLVKYMDKVLDQAYEDGVIDINVSSTTNHPSNSKNTAHSSKNGARALDINYINGKHVSSSNDNSDLLQMKVLNNPGYRENYGPNYQIKNDGNINYYVGNKLINVQQGTTIKMLHQNHIHIAIHR